MNRGITFVALLCLTEAMTLGCGSDENPASPAASGGRTATGGATSSAGTGAKGGTVATGGINATGGALATGGAGASTGGVVTTGGMTATGGALATGGAGASTGGAVATGGAIATGGALASGGTSASAGETIAAGGTVATGGTPETGGYTDVGGTTSTGTLVDAGDEADAGDQADAGSPADAGNPNEGTIVVDTIEAGDISDWTPPDMGGNPVTTFEEITSPYDGSTALRTTVSGNTLMSCPVRSTSRMFPLGTSVSTDAVALRLYLALDSDMTEYNWPGLELALYSEGNVVGYVVYYRAAATGSYIMQRTADWHAIADNGYQILPFSPLLDASSAVSTNPIQFDALQLIIINYTCEGNNSVIIDNVSLVPAT